MRRDGLWLSQNRPEIKTMNLYIEIRAAEGGDDAKQLVREHYRVYEKLMDRERL